MREIVLAFSILIVVVQAAFWLTIYMFSEPDLEEQRQYSCKLIEKE